MGRLALPAFLALVAEPLFLLSDAAVVGHLGTTELAGLGIAAVVLQTVVGLCVFLAYGTTAVVARRLGADDLAGALRQGVDGLWLAVVIGLAATAATIVAAPRLTAAFGAEEPVRADAEQYLVVAALGYIPLLLMLAATGVLRGLQDTRTPLVVAVAGNLLNIVLNVVLVHGVGGFAGIGLVGSALGSLVAQVASAAALVVVVARAARRHAAALRPRWSGVRGAARAGVPLIVRTLTLRAAIVITLFAVTIGERGDSTAIATHQLAVTIWTFLAFVLDAIAIAGQAITGRSLGAGDLVATRRTTTRMTQWGLAAGVLTGVGLAASAPWVGALFTTDDAVRAALVPVLVVAALGQPIAGVVFVLDGVLIGAGDGRYLAVAGLTVLGLTAPALAATVWLGGGLVAVWGVFVLAFMGGRLVTLATRARSETWMRAGATLDD
ncbi:MATE family efflux transporter [Nocardioides sp. R-C-SC26]|uniref:MATE family efflux transporter n=1 Tax=Nocardioides sp. R-C-SC26 TaxID=2870414 RepID=UPI001E63EBC9|nr:MATE family efflux transporter [Nocardioides sp. R-C-SC26]